jgi:chaperone required for assembly of F1-ATPase
LPSPGTFQRKRTYKKVTVAAVEKGHAVHLDGAPLRTPLGGALVLPTRALAQAVAAEWAEQETAIDVERLRLTRIAATALDRVARRRAEMCKEVAAYAETDLLCHRADGPQALIERQQATWQPLLDWLASEFDAPLAATRGVIAQRQPAASLAALSRAVEAFGDWELAALSLAVGAAGSLVIGLALARGRVDVEAAFAAAELDATYQIEQWGEDAEAARRRAAVHADLAAAARFLALLRQD